jgi:hypothetical protein
MWGGGEGGGGGDSKCFSYTFSNIFAGGARMWGHSQKKRPRMRWYLSSSSFFGNAPLSTHTWALPIVKPKMNVIVSICKDHEA